MKKRACALLFSVLLLFSFAMQLTTVGGAVTDENEKVKTIEALNAILIGIDGVFEWDKDVSKWSPEDIYHYVKIKLMVDYSPYTEKIGLESEVINHSQTSSDFSESAYDAAKIQTLTQSALGRAFPNHSELDLVQQSGNKIIFPSYDWTNHFSFFVSDYIKKGDRLIAVGIGKCDNGGFKEDFFGYFQAEYRVNSSSVYGYTLTSFFPIDCNQEFDALTAKASSELRDFSGSRSAKYAVDGKSSTAWIEGGKGEGIGEWIEVKCAKGDAVNVSAVELYLGSHSLSEEANVYGPPTRVRIECDNGYKEDVDISCLGFSVVIPLKKPQTINSMKITILESKYMYGCIGEIVFYGMDLASFFGDYQKDPSASDASDENTDYWREPVYEKEDCIEYGPETLGENGSPSNNHSNETFYTTADIDPGADEHDDSSDSDSSRIVIYLLIALGVCITIIAGILLSGKVRKQDGF